MPVRKEAAPGNDTAAPTVAQLPPDIDPAASRDAQPVDEPAEERTYHDAISGRPVDSEGKYTDGQDEGQVEKHRVVADDWPSHPQR